MVQLRMPLSSTLPAWETLLATSSLEHVEEGRPTARSRDDATVLSAM